MKKQKGKAMFKIKLVQHWSHCIAFLEDDPENCEYGDTDFEAKYKLVDRLISDGDIDNIEFSYISEDEKRSDFEIDRRLNGEI